MEMAQMANGVRLVADASAFASEEWNEGSLDTGQNDESSSDLHRWLRDMGVLAALPGLWVDHEPREIATGLLSALISVLQLESVYARFDASDGGHAIEVWSPSGSSAPAELLHALVVDRMPVSGIASLTVEGGASGALRVVALRLELPWETGLVLTSTSRADFPTAVESHLLRVAVSLAVISIHTARRLSREHAARADAERQLSRQNEILHSLVDEVGTALNSLTRRVHEASRQVSDADSPGTFRGHDHVPAGSTTNTVQVSSTWPEPLLVSRRELEVLALVARGLSNKEIAGVMWLSDRTVERHITSLYRKIGVARRSEATAFALRHEVV
jgi:DNA-binding NarL/FixJ family response regulator